MQHNLAVFLSRFMIEENDTEEERDLTVFGIEIFLNEFLKFLLILLLGLVTGHLWITFLSAVFVFFSRRIIKGGHFKTNLLCTIYTVFSCFVVPVIFMYLKLSFSLLIVFIGLVMVSIPFFCSYDKEEDRRDFRRVVIDMLLFVCFLAIAFFTLGAKASGSIAAVQICIEIMCDKKMHPGE